MKFKQLFKLLLILTISFNNFTLKAQFGRFEVVECQNVSEVIALIDTVFLAGVQPSAIANIEFTGDPRSVGYFRGGTFTGFDKLTGIVMSSGHTGDIDKSNNCNTGQNASSSTSGGSDADLTQAAGFTSQDACIIEFDFKPSADSVKFNYIFASEEYHDFVDSYNDVFGFFLSGPGIDGEFSNGAINIAIIPGTLNTPVTINNVNMGQLGPSCNNLPAGPGDNEQYFNSNTLPNSQAYSAFVFDGYTDNFTAKSDLQICEWYHIKIAIGDVVDSQYDSGVLLEKGSFSLGNITSVADYTHPTVDSLLYESCNDHEVVLYFTLQEAVGFSIKRDLEIGGTATRGEDYELFTTYPGDTIFIEAGTDYDSIIVRAINDDISEDIEDLWIAYSVETCDPTIKDTVKVYFSDLPFFGDTTVSFNGYCEDTINLNFGSALVGIPPFSFDWYTLGEITDTVQFVPTGSDYFAIPCLVADTCGQTSIDTVFVTIPSFEADAGDDQSLCNADSVWLSGMAEGAQLLQWTSEPFDASLTGQENTPNPGVSPTETTMYILAASDNCLHEDSDTTFVFLDEAVANAGSDQMICIGEDVILTCNEAELYSWTSQPVDPSIVGQETNRSIQVFPTVSTIYYVTITDDCDFTATDEVEVIVVELPIAEVGPDAEICQGEQHQLNASGAARFKWSSEPFDASLYLNGQDTLSNPIVSPESPGSYTYLVEVFDYCSSIDSMIIEVNTVPALDLIVQSEEICYGEDVEITVDIEGNYYWTSNPEDVSLSGQEYNQTINVTPDTTTVYQLVADVNGFSCPGVESVTINVIPEILAYFTVEDEEVCQNEALSIAYDGNAASSASYYWDFNSANLISGEGQGPIEISWELTGEKKISLFIIEDGCTSETYEVPVNVLKTPISVFNADVLEGCEPLIVNFINESENIDPNSSYQWEFGDGTISNEESPNKEYSIAGNYTVSLTVTNENECHDVRTLNSLIQVNETPVASFYPEPDETVVGQGIITFSNESTSSEILSYHWDFGDGQISDVANPEHIYNEVGVYLVQMLTVSPNGCENSDEKEVTIHPDANVFPPNAFTPDGDGINDVFEIKGIGINKYSIKIYSRWGELLFESYNIEDQWDGRWKGQLVAKGTYAYLIAYESVVGKSFYKRGTVTIIY